MVRLSRCPTSGITPVVKPWAVALFLSWLNSWTLVGADLNLFMNETETRRLLGIEGELHYVRENVINEYALSFNVPLGPDIHTIYFNWQNIRSKDAIWYNQSISISDDTALKMPKINLQREGHVPTRPSVFFVSLECTGRMDADVDVHITLHIKLFTDKPPKMLDIRRRKTCLKGSTPESDPGYAFSDDKGDVNGGNAHESKDKKKMESSVLQKLVSPSALVFYAVMGLVVLMLVIMGVIVSVCYCNAKKRASERLSDSSSAVLTQYLRADTPKSGGSVVGAQSAISVQNAANQRRQLAPLMQLTPEQVDTMIREIQIDYSQIVLGQVLMEGSFGKIYRGTLMIEQPSNAENTMDVCVKTITEAASPSQIDVFLRECCLLKGHLHAHVNPLIATCLQNEKRPLLIFPYLNEGNLKKFLLRCKISERGTQQSLSTQQLVYIAIQIVRAVQYLHKNRIIHGDIATRNCLVDNQLVVRLGDNALARDLFPADYYCLGDNENRPVKWLSLEALLENKYSYSSDVWAFGVTIWEVMTLAQQPYADVDAFEMDAYLREGYRVSQPLNCPDELFAVMACCWSLVPEERPRIAQLSSCLQDFYTAICQYI